MFPGLGVDDASSFSSVILSLSHVISHVVGTFVLLALRADDSCCCDANGLLSKSLTSSMSHAFAISFMNVLYHDDAELP